MAQTITQMENKREAKEAAPDGPPRGPSVARPRSEDGTWALTVMGIATILAICYFAQETLVVILVSVLIAFILDPIADLFTWLRIPRSGAAALAVVLMLAAIFGLTYLGINKASNLLEELPKHSSEIRQDFAKLTRKAQSLEALNPAPEKGTVKVRESTNWADLLTRGFGSVWQGVLAAS